MVYNLYYGLLTIFAPVVITALIYVTWGLSNGEY